MRGWAIVKMAGGVPDIPPGLDYHGFVLHGQISTWGAYTFSGTLAQLQALAADPNVLAIGRTDASEQVVPLATRTKINNWLTARGLPTFPAGTTALQMAKVIRNQLEAVGQWEDDGINDPEEIIAP